MSKIIVFDFDGVIHSYTSGWQGVDVANDPPVDRIKEYIDQLVELGYTIVIQSSRCNSEKGIECIKDYCLEYNIEYHEITNNKPPAYLTIDDRAICFNPSNISSLIDEIENFKPWTQLKDAMDSLCIKQDNISNDYMNKLKLKETLEGRMLLAAASILTNSKFIFYGNEIEGTKKEPNENFDMLNTLCNDIFEQNNDIITDQSFNYDEEIKKLQDRNQEIVLILSMHIDKKFTNVEECLVNEIANNSIEIERLLNIKFNNIKYKEAMKIISNELKSDKSGGSMYYAWQSNLACIMQDNSNIDHELSNKIACKFLDRLIENSNK